MKKNVIVLDANRAVQAITVTALKPLPVSVHCFDSVTIAMKAIADLQPTVVICASDIDRSNVLDIWEQTKRLARSAPPFFVVLLREKNNSLEKLGREAGVSALLQKPFKADELRQLIEKLLTPDNAGAVAILVRDEHAKRLLYQYFKKSRIEYFIANDFASLEAEAKKRSLQATIIDPAEAKRHQSFDEQRMGKLIIYGGSDNDVPFKHVTLLSPLSVQVLDNIFGTPSSVSESEDSPLDNGEQTLLAAHISAAIYEKLLTQEALRYRRWEEASAQVAAVVLKICRSSV